MVNLWEDLAVEDRGQDVLGQYDFSVNSIRRVRGAQLLDTDKGVFLLAATSCRERRLAMENKIKEHLMGQGYGLTDLYLKNTAGEYLSTDRYGSGYVVKRWFLGEEVSLREPAQAAMAAGNLGRLHRLMKGIFWEDNQPIFLSTSNESLIRKMERHTQELKRVYTYILNKNQKSDFENLYLSLYNSASKQAADALKVLKGSEYEKLTGDAVEDGEIIHGSYNQHKVIILDEGMATIDFSKAESGMQLLDFYHFLRKTLEKNEWDAGIAGVVTDAYQREKEISREEWKILYGLFLYPEKFWKAANYYNNSRKSWVSTRTFQKLENVKEQQEKRLAFLKNLK